MSNLTARSGSMLTHVIPVSFTFNGRHYWGQQGDTLASALLANGVKLLARSFKYHRPRGVFSAGSEEPSAIVEIGEGAYREPNVRATEVEIYPGLVARSQNCWPSLNWDLLAVNNRLSRLIPAGFYYKTFMRPKRAWLFYEHWIRKSAGLGRAPEEADGERYEKHFAHCDLLIVGAGPTGLAAAWQAAHSGARVILVDERPALGGQLLDRSEQQTIQPWLAALKQQLAAFTNLRIMSRTSLAGYYDHNFCTLLERCNDHLAIAQREGPRQRLWKLRAKQVLLASGAIERPLVFADNDRPGVMLSSAVSAYLNRYGVLPGKQLLLLTAGDGGYRAALDALAAGVEVTVADLRERPVNWQADSLAAQAMAAGADIHWRSSIAKVIGSKAVSGALLRQLNEPGDALQGPETRVQCQCIAVHGGWTPNVSLHSQARGKLEYQANYQQFWPVGEVAINPNLSAGSCRGLSLLHDCLADGAAVAKRLLARLSYPCDAPALMPLDIADDPVSGSNRQLWCLPSDKANGKAFHELQNDATAADIQLAWREGFHSVEHLKRYTTTGMGTDQGKTSNINALAIMAEYRRLPIDAVGTTRFRPPYTPVSFGAIAARDSGRLFAPYRETSIQPWHTAHGAVMDDLGGWRRPLYYKAHAGETDHQAVSREVAAVRRAGGLFDASTLGKIDIQGRDAQTFLERVTPSRWSDLAIGQCRYSLLLNEQGMVIDDGVTCRLSEQHFHMTTTSGGAARVYEMLEDYRQTEWPELEVYLTSVTEQWAVISLSGPQAARVLQPLVEEPIAELSMMSCQSLEVAGISARVMRVSFTGEPGFEVNVPARFGLALWRALWQQAEPLGCVAYGTEALHVLRAEMGFLICGQDSDGTATPMDMGLGWLLDQSKSDFIGKRALARTLFSDGQRRQWVGLKPLDPTQSLPEGGQVVMPGAVQGVDRGIGHVTSSYFSPTMDSHFALAMVQGGHARRAEQLAVMTLQGELIAVTVVARRFVSPDPECLAVEFEKSEAQVLEPWLNNWAGGLIAPDWQLKVLPMQAKWQLRGVADVQLTEALKAQGLALPEVTYYQLHGANRLYGLGPDEWLWLGELPAWVTELPGLYSVEVSDYYLRWQLSGDIYAALSQLCHLDLTDSSFAPGRCRQTLLGQAPVLLSRTDSAVDIQVRVSYSGYLWEYFCQLASSAPSQPDSYDGASN